MNIIDDTKEIELHVFSPSYTALPGKAYLIWFLDYGGMEYEIYRNDILIASTENGISEIKHPSEFDKGWYTNLFKRKSRHQLMFIDTNVRKYQYFTYQVKGFVRDKSGNPYNIKESIPTTIWIM